MWIRSAFWLGTPKDGARTHFRAAIDGEIVPGLRALPFVRDVKALWPERREDDPPNLALQILVQFDDRQGVDGMLASAERRAMRARVVEIAALFDGTISHIDYEVGA